MAVNRTSPAKSMAIFTMAALRKAIHFIFSVWVFICLLAANLPAHKSALKDPVPLDLFSSIYSQNSGLLDEKVRGPSLRNVAAKKAVQTTVGNG